MSTEYFSVKHTSGKTVYFRFLDPSNGEVFDFDDDAWEANLAACADPKLAATENTDFGDADESLYIAGTDLTDMYDGTTPTPIIVQAMDDLGTDVIVEEGEFWIFSGGRLTGNYIGVAGTTISGTVSGETISGEVS